MIALEWLPFSLRYAVRSLLRRPTLAIVAVATLGLAIGVNTAMFSIVNAVLLRPLPLKDPARLVMVWRTAPSQGLRDGLTSYPDFRDWREQSEALAGLAAFWTFPNGDVNLTGGSEPERVSVARITPGFFEVLGVAPLYGRTFLPEESIVGNHRRAIVSYGLWKRQFAGDSALVGGSVTVNGLPYEVVGIMPAELGSLAGAGLGTDVELWRPLVPEDNQTGGRGARKLRVVGRIRAGVAFGEAEAEVAAIATRLAQTYPETNRDDGIRLVALREQVVRNVRRGLVLLLAAVAVVMLVACVNVANLLLVKSATTRREVAVRQALGASRVQLGAQVLMESLVLAGSGAGLGLLLAYGSVKAVVAFGPRDIPLLAGTRIDASVLTFTLMAALFTTVLFGVGPAFRSAATDVTMVLRQGSGRSRAAGDYRLMSVLTVSQIALAMVLLTAGGLLLRSFQMLLRVDLGIVPERVLTFQLELPMATYPSQPARDAFFANLLARVEGLPGVRAASMASAPPIEDQPAEYPFTQPGSSDDRRFDANVRLVAPGYFALLGIPIRRGRAVLPSDGRQTPRAAIVSEALARSVWGRETPVGARIASPFGGEVEVVGVAGDVRTTGLNGDPGRIVYLAAAQHTYNFMTIMVTSRSDALALAAPLRALVRELDPGLPVHHVRTVDHLVARSVARQGFQAGLVSLFSLLVFLLAGVGTYGVVSYMVTERSSELGVRVALGATARDIRQLVVTDGARLALGGIALGAAASAALSQTLSRFVYQISVLDPVTFAAAAALLASAVLLATWLPAYRATRIDPMRVLRMD